MELKFFGLRIGLSMCKERVSFYCMWDEKVMSIFKSKPYLLIKNADLAAILHCLDAFRKKMCSHIFQSFVKYFLLVLVFL